MTFEEITLTRYDFRIAAARAEKEEAIDNQDFNGAASARDREKKLVRERAMMAKLIREVGGRMFERFTDRARRVVVLAQEEARMLNHNYIGTEHILLGLVHEGEGVAAKSLERLGVSLVDVRTQIEEIIGQGQEAPSGHIPFTARAKKVLELSLREALQLGHNYIGTEHILLGLVREGEGVAAQILVKLGAELTRVRQTIIQILSGYQGDEATLKAKAEGEKVTEFLAEAAKTKRPDVPAAEFALEMLKEALPLTRILYQHDIKPNIELLTQLIEWKSIPE